MYSDVFERCRLCLCPEIASVTAVRSLVISTVSLSMRAHHIFQRMFIERITSACECEDLVCAFSAAWHAEGLLGAMALLAPILHPAAPTCCRFQT